MKCLTIKDSIALQLDPVTSAAVLGVMFKLIADAAINGGS